MVDPIALPRIPDVQPRNSHLLQFVPTDHAVTDAGLITLVIQHSMVQLAFSENIVKMPKIHASSPGKQNKNDDLIVFSPF